MSTSRFLWGSDHATCSTLKRKTLKSPVARIMWSFFNNFTFYLLFFDVEPISVMNRSAPNRPDPTRPDPTRPCRDALVFFFSHVLKYTNLKLSHNIDIGLINVILNFHREFFIISEAIACLAKTDFCLFYIHFCSKTHKQLNIFKIWSSHVKERLKAYQNHYWFLF